MHRRLLTAVLLSLACSLTTAWGGEPPAESEKRLADAVRYLASDELEGRGLGTKGIELAAEFIARQFREAGLKTDLFAGQPYQKFSIAGGVELGKENRLTLVGPPAGDGAKVEPIELKLGQDFTPLAFSSAAAFDAPLAFAGYGITATAEKYDDFQGIDLTGKAVIVLRHQPQQSIAGSRFGGAKESPHAWMTRKVTNAREHKAAAVIFCTDQWDIRRQLIEIRQKWQQGLDRLAAEHAKLKQLVNPSIEEIESQRQQIEKLLREVEQLGKQLQEHRDPLLPVAYAADGKSLGELPVLNCRRAVLDRALKAALGTDLATLERQIDEGPTPRSRELPGWRVSGKTDLRATSMEIKNVAAVLEGTGPTADETVVVGAHYDHLGHGGRGALGEQGSAVIYHGADDNASGTAVLLEVARSLAHRGEKLHRRVIFVAFTGEEAGILGSQHYVAHPPTPLERTVAMVNFDMVGRLRDDHLMILGVNSGRPFGALLDQLGAFDGLRITRLPTAAGPSDQLAFYGRKIPVMHFFTGLHGEYHRPTDTFETLNIGGMRRIARMAEEVVVRLANAPARPEYVAEGGVAGMLLGDSKRPRLGIVPLQAATDGVGVAEVVSGGPAERGGLQKGDVLTEMDGATIHGMSDLDQALRKHKSGDKVRVVVRRGSTPVTAEITLE